MIRTADEFQRLRSSDDADEQRRASNEAADEGVWTEVILRFPKLRCWVAHNKTVPLHILRALAADADADVRHAVAMKRKLDRPLFELLARDVDPAVRARIACNAKTPTDLRKSLGQDPVAFVAEAAAEHLIA